MSQKHSYCVLFCIFTALALTTSCSYDAPTFKQSPCTDAEEGTTRESDSATCTDGFWVVPDVPDSGSLTDTSPNACGGNTQLTHEPGTACGVCQLDQYVCEGTEKTTCEDTIGCPPNMITMEEITVTEAGKATLHATIFAVDEENIPVDHGFCWAVKNGAGETEECKSLGTLTTAHQGEKITLDIENLWSGLQYRAQAYYETTDKPGEKQRSPEALFLSFAPAPTELVASNDQSSHITLAWKAAEDALGYKVYRDGVHVPELDDALKNKEITTIDDTAANRATLTFADAPTASTDNFGHVLLTGSAATITAPAPNQYTVTALYPDTESAPSNHHEGQLVPGEISYRWLASAIQTPTETIYLTDAAPAPITHEDTTAPNDGTPRDYYLEASAPGAITQRSTKATGNKKPAGQPTLTTLPATELTATQAKLNAEITTLGVPPATEHGFCWGTTAAPTDCTPASETTALGPFSSMTSNNLTPGTQYFFRAYVKTLAGITYANDLNFITVPAAPANLTATQDLNDRVTVTWTKSAGATNYIMTRDNNPPQTLGDVDSYVDLNAALPSSLAAPTSFKASTDKTDHVLLTWTAVPPQTGNTHIYKVIAVNDSGQSPESITSGHTRIDATGYEFSINESDTWIPALSTTEHKHMDAPAPQIKNFEIELTQSSNHLIVLSVESATIENGAATGYQLRATSGTQKGAKTTQKHGNRISCPFSSYEWEYAETQQGGFNVISEATQHTLVIANNDRKPYYRVTLNSACSASRTSSPYYTGQ